MDGAIGQIVGITSRINLIWKVKGVPWDYRRVRYRCRRVRALWRPFARARLVGPSAVMPVRLGGTTITSVARLPLVTAAGISLFFAGSCSGRGFRLATRWLAQGPSDGSRLEAGELGDDA